MLGNSGGKNETKNPGLDGLMLNTCPSVAQKIGPSCAERVRLHDDVTGGGCEGQVGRDPRAMRIARNVPSDNLT